MKGCLNTEPRTISIEQARRDFAFHPRESTSMNFMAQIVFGRMSQAFFSHKKFTTPATLLAKNNSNLNRANAARGQG